MLLRKYFLISFRALNDRLAVAILTGNVAKIYCNVSVIDYWYVPSCSAVLRVTLFQRKIQPKYTALPRVSGVKYFQISERISKKPHH